jgi:hypothetical protein
MDIKSKPQSQEREAERFPLPGPIPRITFKCIDCEFSWTIEYSGFEFDLRSFYEKNRSCERCGGGNIRMALTIRY